MTKPIRIQRKRTKGWKMPENTIYVGRGSKYGNPFTGPDAVEKFRKMIMAKLSDDRTLIRHNISELRGKNLACWCKLSEKCHADVLLSLANKEQV